MNPQQLDAERGTHLDDIYSLGEQRAKHADRDIVF
jgi:hypothetical protein